MTKYEHKYKFSKTNIILIILFNLVSTLLVGLLFRHTGAKILYCKEHQSWAYSISSWMRLLCELIFAAILVRCLLKETVLYKVIQGITCRGLKIMPCLHAVSCAADRTMRATKVLSFSWYPALMK